MSLYKIKDFDPNYRQYFDDRDPLKFDVYSGSEKVGSVDDLLVDDHGQFRYFVINTGAWIVGKKVLLPIGRSHIDENARRIYADGLTRDQVKRLPEYTGEPIDYDYEERVRGVYRPAVDNRTVAPSDYDRNSYRYDRDPALYRLPERNHTYLSRPQSRLMSGRPLAGEQRRGVGVFPNRRAAEQALHELRDSGFPMDRVSVVARDGDQQDDIAGADVRDHVGNKADEGAAIGAISGGALGGLTGLLVGLGTLAIPGIGPIMLAGTTATTLATALAGGAIGAVSGGLLGGLIGLGIPEERARVYHDRIARGGYLVIVDGTDAEIGRAEAILRHRGIEDYGVYDAPRTTSAASDPVATPVGAAPGSAPVAAPTVSGTPAARQSAVGFFPKLSDAEHAIIDLRSIGFPPSQITLVTRDLQRRGRFAGIDLRDRFAADRLGIPAEQERFYHDRVGRGEYMVIVQGTEKELNRAATILTRRGIQDWRIYGPGVAHERPVEAPRVGSAAVPVTSTSVASTSSVPASSIPASSVPVSDPPASVMPASGAADVSTASAVDRPRYAVGFFPHYRDAEQAVADLKQAGFPLGQILLVAQRFEQRDPFTGIHLRDRFDNSRLGFPEERVRLFNDRIARGDYLVVMQGTREQLRQAEALLHRPRIHDFSIYDAPDTTEDQLNYERVRPGDADYIASDPNPARPAGTVRVEQPLPNVTIVDRRDDIHR